MKMPPKKDGFLGWIFGKKCNMKTIRIKTIGCKCGWRAPYNKELIGTLCEKCGNKIRRITDLEEMIIMNVADEQVIDEEIKKIEEAEVKNDLPDISTKPKKNAYILQRKKEIADALKRAKALEQ